MSHDIYHPLDPDQSIIRLISLSPGQFRDEIECKLFTTKLNEQDSEVHYEALSYTWGAPTLLATIKVNGHPFRVTSNLFHALLYLRRAKEKRVLWIDAICIDQSNLQERGHQIKHMRSIYNRAAQVLIWLGPNNDKTDALMTGARLLEEKSTEENVDCIELGKAWMAADDSPTSVASLPPHQWRNRRNEMRVGLYQLLRRPWFRRVWVLQEVASARSASFVCGSKHVSADVFSILAVILRVYPGFHSESVLEIMGKTTQTSRRDLRTLLVKFAKCEASDPRDRIFALLGISTDANDSEMLFADYTKRISEVIAITTKFLFSRMNTQISTDDVPDWTISEFFSCIQALPELCHQFDLTIFLKRRHEPSLPLSLYGPYGKQIFLITAARTGDLRLVELLVEQDVSTLFMQDADGYTALSWAAATGNEAVVRYLAEKDPSQLDRTHNRWGFTPLSRAAAEGHLGVVKLLVENHKVDPDLKDRLNMQTPLSRAAARGHAAVVKVLVERDDVNADARDMLRFTPLMWAAVSGYTEVVKLLLSRSDVDVNAKDKQDQTAYSKAVSRGRDRVVELLRSDPRLETDTISDTLQPVTQ